MSNLIFNAGIVMRNTKAGEANRSAGIVRRRLIRRRFLPMAFCLALALLLVPRDSGMAQGPAPAPATTPTLDAGYQQMYNLDFANAHQTFAAFQRLNPGDPLGPTSDAAAYLFSEFDKLGILQTELFVDDELFKSRKKVAPDPASRKGFDADISKSEQLADMNLMQSASNSNALLAKVMNHGLRADYLAMIERRNLAALGDIKRAGVLAEKLLAVNPSCYDAYLAVGVENYMLSLNPAPVRWVMRAYGAETDKSQGIQKLNLTATKGHYLAPYARLMLAVAALRDNHKEEARQLLESLSREFPSNALYSRELSRIQ